MYRKHTSITKITAIASLTLLIVLSNAWTSSFYSKTVLVKKRGGGEAMIVGDSDGKLIIRIEEGALDDYMADQGLDHVEISAETEKRVATSDDGRRCYLLDFTFGPSGAYFDLPLELIISGNYVKQDCEVWLYDENGEALEGEYIYDGDAIVFYLHHFSSYAYDDYSY